MRRHLFDMIAGLARSPEPRHWPRWTIDVMWYILVDHSGYVGRGHNAGRRRSAVGS